MNKISKVLIALLVLGIVIIATYYSYRNPKENFSNKEIPLQAIFERIQPGAIKSIKAEGVNQWNLAVDILEHNPDFLPGVTDFFINKNPSIANLTVTTGTKTYLCGAGPDGNETTPDVLENTGVYMIYVQNVINSNKSLVQQGIGGVENITDWATLYFDIDGVNVTSMYQQCLP